MLQIVLIVALLLVPWPARAEKRVALVIGNSAYENVPPLSNPSRDAAAMQAMLQAAGFDIVQVKNDLNAAAMRRALRDFSNQAHESDIALIFYAGHGIEMNGSNYLIPVDAILERDTDVADETVSLDRLLQTLEGSKRLRLVILDACRENPFSRSIKRTLATRSVGRGLAEVEVQTSDTLIAFAAKAGLTAADGDGENSPYTLALVKHLGTPGLDLRIAFGRVRDDVLRSTARKQEPFVYGSLGGEELWLVKPRLGSSQPPLLLLTQSSWNHECVADPLPEVSVLSAPRHGAVRFGEGIATVTLVHGADKRCLGSSVRSKYIYYVPSGSHAEADEVSLAVVSARGERWGYNCTINIRDRESDCQLWK